jgi:CRISPR-associated protein Cmr5
MSTPLQTKSQRIAQAAYKQVAERQTSAGFKDYSSFAKKFPALVHTCGLAQAVAFALAKGERGYLDDLAVVLRAGGHTDIDDGNTLDKQSRELPFSGYLRLSRDALAAASWLKRYAEALEKP